MAYESDWYWNPEVAPVDQNNKVVAALKKLGIKEARYLVVDGSHESHVTYIARNSIDAALAKAGPCKNNPIITIGRLLLEASPWGSLYKKEWRRAKRCAKQSR